MSLDAATLLRDAMVVDGLVFFSDGDASGLKSAHVDAVNLTVSHFEADFTEACNQIAVWLDRIAAAGSPWLLVSAVDDIRLARERGKVGLIMGWQNMRPIEDRLERLRLFHRLGIRVMQLTYNRRNFLGDGCLEADNGGLSELGRGAIKLMNEIGIAIDLSHVGERSSREAAEQSLRPVLVTHANARAVVDVPRNKGDDVLKAVAATGGVIGASVYGTMCWRGDPKAPPRLDDFLRQLDYLVGLVGVAHVGIGTDLPSVSHLDAVKPITEMTLRCFPGAIADYAKAFGNDIRSRYVQECADHAGLAAIVETLIVRGWRDADLRALLGGNFLRALDAAWRPAAT